MPPAGGGQDGGGEGTPPPARPRRHCYEKVVRELEARWKRHPIPRPRMMQEIVDALWDELGGGALAWVGFYCPSPDGQLVLGPHRDKPAASPIGAHGVCGRAVSEKVSQVVSDVRALGAAYIECDPSHQSEIAVPVFDQEGRVFAVLDADSREKGAFDHEDRRWLERIVKPLGQADTQ